MGIEPGADGLPLIGAEWRVLVDFVGLSGQRSRPFPIPRPLGTGQRKVDVGQVERIADQLVV